MEFEVQITFHFLIWMETQNVGILDLVVGLSTQIVVKVMIFLELLHLLRWLWKGHFRHSDLYFKKVILGIQISSWNSLLKKMKFNVIRQTLF